MTSTMPVAGGFGLIYVDFDTLERTPKPSAERFRETARQNAVV
jgi:beta-glucosidase/6-phospho-beta-glucosidase/beta-galactosidase